MADDNTPWFVVKADIGSNPKLAELPNDSARWGWVAGVLAAAKRQRPSGRFTSRNHFDQAVPAFARFLAKYIAGRLLEVAPDLCPRCQRVWSEVPDGWIVVHDWHGHQRDPGSAERSAKRRAERDGNAGRTLDDRGANDARPQEERTTTAKRPRGDTVSSRARATTGTETETVEHSAERSTAHVLGDDLVGLIELIEEKTGRPWTWSQGSRTIETLRYDVRDHGEPAVRRQLLAAHRSNPTTDGNVLVFDAHKLLEPMTGSRVNGRPPSASNRVRTSTENYDETLERDEEPEDLAIGSPPPAALPEPIAPPTPHGPVRR